MRLESLNELNPDILKRNPELNDTRITLKSDTRKESKYHNHPTEFQGKTYASGKEARRAQELTLLENSHLIICLRHHVRFDISPDNHVGRPVQYEADFVYISLPDLQVHIEDVKSDGTETPTFKMKVKYFRDKYGKDVEIIK